MRLFSRSNVQEKSCLPTDLITIFETDVIAARHAKMLEFAQACPRNAYLPGFYDVGSAVFSDLDIYIVFPYYNTMLCTG